MACYARRMVGALCIYGCRLSVRLSVCPVPDPKSRTEGRRKLTARGGKPVTQVIRDARPRSKRNVTRPLDAATENQPHLWNRKACKNFKLVRLHGWSTIGPCD